ncbi:MAG: histone-like protein [Candidatus Hodarchaeales archaeon]
MSQPQDISKNTVTKFSSAEIKRILKKTGIPRISQDSIEALNRLITGRAKQIAAKAVQIASEFEREEIREEDITKAVRMSSPVAVFEVDPDAPFVHYVWFIGSGGTCLLSRSYSGLEFPDTIFAGLLTGIVDLMAEVTGRVIEKFSTDDLIIHIRRISEITVAVICDSEKDEPIDELTDLLAHRFNEVFMEEVRQDVIDTSIFEEFTPVLDALVSSAGLKIPQHTLKVSKEAAALSERQLEESVDAAALREALRRAKEQIQDLAIFKKDGNEEELKAAEMGSLIDEPPDVTEIKVVLKQASQDLREEMNGEKENENNEVSREEVMKEIEKDFGDMIDKEKIKSKPKAKKTKKQKKPKTTKKKSKARKVKKPRKRRRKK